MMATVTESWNMKCPNAACDRDDKLDVQVTTRVRLTGEGSDYFGAANHDEEWDDESPCTCGACGRAGKVAEFKVEK